MPITTINLLKVCIHFAQRCCYKILTNRNDWSTCQKYTDILFNVVFMPRLLVDRWSVNWCLGSHYHEVQMRVTWEIGTVNGYMLYIYNYILLHCTARVPCCNCNQYTIVRDISTLICVALITQCDVCIYVCMCVRTCMHARTLCMYVCMYVCTYVTKLINF